MDFVASLAAAVKQRNVLALVEATLRLNAGSEMVPPLVQRLVFQVPTWSHCGCFCLLRMAFTWPGPLVSWFPRPC